MRGDVGALGWVRKPHAARPASRSLGGALAAAQALCVAAVVFYQIGGALAQTVEPPDPSAAAILVVSLERIREQAQASRSIQAQAAEERRQIQDEIGAKQRALEAEERALVALRDTMEPDAFEARAARFEGQVRALKQKRRDRAEALRRALGAATDRLDAALRPILAEIMAERGALVMLENRTVVLSATALDVTAIAIKRLDAALPTLEVDVEAVQQP